MTAIGWSGGMAETVAGGCTGSGVALAAATGGGITIGGGDIVGMPVCRGAGSFEIENFEGSGAIG